jgi:hypothetical protein
MLVGYIGFTNVDNVVINIGIRCRNERNGSKRRSTDDEKYVKTTSQHLSHTDYFACPHAKKISDSMPKT